MDGMLVSEAYHEDAKTDKQVLGLTHCIKSQHLNVFLPVNTIWHPFPTLWYRYLHCIRELLLPLFLVTLYPALHKGSQTIYYSV